ncbi:hypothetical protein D3C83_35580 [compost metagenome]
MIGTADPDTASLLQVPLGAPTAECRCVVKNREGVALYVADITYRNDCVKLYIDLFGRAKSRAKLVAAVAAAPRPGNGGRSRRRGRKATH